MASTLSSLSTSSWVFPEIRFLFIYRLGRSRLNVVGDLNLKDLHRCTHFWPFKFSFFLNNEDLIMISIRFTKVLHNLLSFSACFFTNGLHNNLRPSISENSRVDESSRLLHISCFSNPYCITIITLSCKKLSSDFFDFSPCVIV